MEHYKLNLEIPEYNQVTFGSRSLHVFLSKVWNSLLHHIKSSKEVIKNWNGIFFTCRCHMAYVSVTTASMFYQIISNVDLLGIASYKAV